MIVEKVYSIVPPPPPPPPAAAAACEPEELQITEGMISEGTIELRRGEEEKEDGEEIPRGSSAIILEAIGEDRVSNKIPAVILDEKMLPKDTA